MKNNTSCKDCTKPAEMSCNCKSSLKLFCYTHLAMHLQDNSISHMVASLDDPDSAPPTKAKTQKLDKLKSKLLDYKERVKSCMSDIEQISKTLSKIVQSEIKQPHNKLRDLIIEIDHQAEQLEFFKSNFSIEAEKIIQKCKGNDIKPLLKNYDPLDGLNPVEFIEAIREELGVGKKIQKRPAGKAQVEELKGELKSSEKILTQFTKQIEKHEQTIRMKDEKILELTRKLKESEEIIHSLSASRSKPNLDPSINPQYSSPKTSHFSPQLFTPAKSEPQVNNPLSPVLNLPSNTFYKDSRQVALLEGHSGPVMCCTTTLDGKYLISGGWDSSIRIWDLHTFRHVARLKGHTDHVLSVVVSKDSKFIISASDDSTIRIWSLASQQEETTLMGHSSWVNEVVLTRYDEFIISASKDKTIRIWNLALRTLVSELHGHTEDVKSVAISSDDSLIASGSGDYTIRLWDFRTHASLGILKGHRDTVTSLCITSDRKHLISSSNDMTIGVWNLTSLTQEVSLKGHTDYVRSVSLTSDDQFIISAGRDCTVRIWKLRTRSIEAVLEGHKDAVWCAVPSADNKYIFSGSGRLGFTAFFSNGDCSLRAWSFYS
jgi:WD40 repeat protein